MNAVQLLSAVSGLRGLLEKELQSEMSNDGLSASFSYCVTHTFSISLYLPLSLSLYLKPSPIFSGSPDYPPSLGGERLRTKLPPVCADPQTREQVPRQICR